MTKYFILIMFLVGCYHPKVENNGMHAYSKPWHRAVAELSVKTASMTNCPTNQLQAKLLRIDRYWPASIVVYGCGYEVYFDYNIRNRRAGWVLTATRGFNPAAPVVVLPVVPTAPVINQTVNVNVIQQQ